MMQKETFYKELPSIDQCTAHLEDLYDAAFEAAVQQRSTDYTSAVEQLKSTAGWDQLDEDVQQRIGDPLSSRTSTTFQPQHRFHNFEPTWMRATSDWPMPWPKCID